MEQNGWELFNAVNYKITRANSTGAQLTVGQNYQIRLLDPDNLRFSTPPTLSYQDGSTSGSLTFTPVSGKPGVYQVYVENTGNRRYSSISAFTSKAAGVTIPTLDTVPLGTVYGGESFELEVTGGLDKVGFWASVRKQSDKGYVMPFTLLP
ncbi:hypothetical protein N1032_23340, partial [Herbiconiux sp. CPCC 203386]|nr:hypothetical protein [Herbiconiux daphne]